MNYFNMLATGDRNVDRIIVKPRTNKTYKRSLLLRTCLWNAVHGILALFFNWDLIDWILLEPFVFSLPMTGFLLRYQSYLFLIDFL